jgi:hypothetical protein
MRALGYGRALAWGEVVSDGEATVEGVGWGERAAVSPQRVVLNWVAVDALAGWRITPREGGETMGELERQIREAQAVLDSLMAVRRQLPRRALYERDRLFAQIEAQRGILARLERQRVLGPARRGEVRWSGRVVVRGMREEG